MACGEAIADMIGKKKNTKCQQQKRSEPSLLGMCLVHWGHAPDCLAVLMDLSIGKGA